MLYKTKHRVIYRGSGVSFGFVFRFVQKTSKFDPVTSRWLWEREPLQTKKTVEKQLAKIESKNYIVDTNEKKLEMSEIDNNVSRFLEQMSSKNSKT